MSRSKTTKTRHTRSSAKNEAPEEVESSEILLPRLSRAFGPIAAGIIIDTVDFATFGPIGMIIGLPIGGLAGYWMGRCLRLDRRGCWLCAAVAGVYCTIPFTEYFPLATLVGAYARFKEGEASPGAKDTISQKAAPVSRRHAPPIQRRMYWSEDATSMSCPECGGMTVKEPQDYLVELHHGGEKSLFIITASCNAFCPKCPVIILDRMGMEIEIGVTEYEGKVNYSVLGIVDMEAIPLEQRGLPLDDETNPPPLTPFLDHDAK